jgi:hypothetical protein
MVHGSCFPSPPVNPTRKYFLFYGYKFSETAPRPVDVVVSSGHRRSCGFSFAKANAAFAYGGQDPQFYVNQLYLHHLPLQNDNPLLTLRLPADGAIRSPALKTAPFSPGATEPTGASDSMSKPPNPRPQCLNRKMLTSMRKWRRRFRERGICRSSGSRGGWTRLRTSEQCRSRVGWITAWSYQVGFGSE